MGHGTCRVSTCTTLRIRTSLNFMPKAPHIPPMCPGLGRKANFSLWNIEKFPRVDNFELKPLRRDRGLPDREVGRGRDKQTSN